MLALAAESAAAQPPPHSGPGPAPFTAADVHFVSGMIEHHAQAVRMALWAPTHGAGSAVRELCDRIVVSQRDEIAFMQRWLKENHQSVPEVDSTGRVAGGMASMPGMPGMGGDTLMPGMLTSEQMAQLDGAHGSRFDELFLRFMIQHHQGALTMVQRLMDTPGAAVDGRIYQFASDVNADQTAEIARMRRMLVLLTLEEGNQ